MRYLIVSDGVVVNAIDADEAFAQSIGAIAGDADIGDLYDGQTFTKPTPTVEVPQRVTMRQARVALIAHGLIDAVEAAIDAISDPTQRKIARATWDYSSEVQRNQALVLMLAPAIGLTSAQLDALFIDASKQ